MVWPGQRGCFIALVDGSDLPTQLVTGKGPELLEAPPRPRIASMPAGTFVDEVHACRKGDESGKLQHGRRGRGVDVNELDAFDLQFLDAVDFAVCAHQGQKSLVRGQKRRRQHITQRRVVAVSPAALYLAEGGLHPRAT